MAELFPEWIQEQLDEMGRQRRHNDRVGAILASQAGMVRLITERFDRIEAKLDQLIALCNNT